MRIDHRWILVLLAPMGLLMGLASAHERGATAGALWVGERVAEHLMRGAERRNEEGRHHEPRGSQSEALDQRRACNEHFSGGRMPMFSLPAYGQNTVLLCNAGYATLYSGKTRTPLWSAEYLTPERVAMAHNVRRTSSFWEDTRVPESWRDALSDYARSGFDRGHMAPSGDMASLNDQAQSFSLANVVPQDPHNNRGPWAGIEEAVRAYASQHAVYVVTGPLFIGQNIGFLKGRVAVPTHLYKLVYDPEARAAAAYLSANAANAAMETISLEQLMQISHTDYGYGSVRRLTLPASRGGFHEPSN